MLKEYSLWELIVSDYKKVRNSASLFNIFSALLMSGSFKRILLFRLQCKFRKNVFLNPILFILNKIASSHYNVYIDKDAKIGKGLHFPHCFSIMITACTIGDDVTIIQQTTIGQSRANRNGTPIIGNNVVIGAGAKVIGKVKIGNNVAVGANAVVTKDIPDNSVAAGIPAKIISNKGKETVWLWTLNQF